MKRFEREAQATALLTSPHTIDLYDYGVAQDGTFFYAMEYLDGLDLDTLVDEHGPVPVERAVHLLTQACDSLADAHEHGLIHRDVKPGNIFAARMGIQHDFVKVLDFGLVKDTRPEEGATALTQDGMTSGTPAFMPPEVALAQDNVDERADIYALACVGYWLTTGQYVFVADSPMAMVVDHVKSEPPAPSTRTELAIPPEFDEVILRALAKDPGDRYQNMREFAHALRQVPVRKPWDEARAAEWWQLRNGDAAVAEATTVH
jgi:serine/threonine-protein kinase